MSKLFLKGQVRDQFLKTFTSPKVPNRHWEIKFYYYYKTNHIQTFYTLPISFNQRMTSYWVAWQVPDQAPVNMLYTQLISQNPPSPHLFNSSKWVCFLHRGQQAMNFLQISNPLPLSITCTRTHFVFSWLSRKEVSPSLQGYFLFSIVDFTLNCVFQRPEPVQWLKFPPFSWTFVFSLLKSSDIWDP